MCVAGTKNQYLVVYSDVTGTCVADMDGMKRAEATKHDAVAKATDTSKARTVVKRIDEGVGEGQ